MGLFLFFFFSFVQAHVVSLPSNITHALGSSGFRIDGQTPLTGREVHPLTPNLIKQNDEQLKVGRFQIHGPRSADSP